MKKSIYVELKKIIKRKSFLVINLLLIISTILLTVSVKEEKSYEYSYESKLEEQEFYDLGYEDYKSYLKKFNEYENLVSDQLILNEYKLGHDIVDNSFIKSKLNVSFTILLFLGIYTVIVSASSFGREYDKNTIKWIMLNSKAKKSVVYSKLISLLIIVLYLAILIFGINIITTMIVSKTNIFKILEYSVIKGNIIKKSLVFKHTCEYLKMFFPQILLIIISLFLGLLFKSGSIASTISIFLFLSSSLITELFVKLKIKFITYTFIPYLDFSIFQNKFNLILYNIENNIDLGLKKGVIIIIITSFILLILSNILFKRREFK